MLRALATSPVYEINQGIDGTPGIIRIRKKVSPPHESGVLSRMQLALYATRRAPQQFRFAKAWCKQALSAWSVKTRGCSVPALC